MTQLHFSVEQEITQPNLRRTSRSNQVWAAQMSEILKLNQSTQTGLTDDGPMGKWPDEVRDSIGTLLGQAILHNAIDAAVIIARVWVYNYKDQGTASNILTQATGYLEDEGRLDLFRPLTALLVQTAQKVWQQSANARQTLPPAFRGPAIPSLDETLGPDAVDLIRLANKSSGALGASALYRLGINMMRVAAQGVLEHGRGNAPVLEAVVDAITSLQELHPWAGWAVLSALEDMDMRSPYGDGQEKLDSLRPLISDSAAAAILRRVAAITDPGEVTGRMVNPPKIIARMITDHAKMTLNDWLTLSTPEEVLNPDRREDGRTALESYCDPTKGSSMVPHQLGEQLRCYDVLISWLGSSRGEELSARTHQVLSKYLSDVVASSEPLQHLRSALDRWSLVWETGAKADDDPLKTQQKNRRTL